MRTAIGARTIDELLGGGFESGIITEIYGEAGTGKTNICLQLGKVIAGVGRKVAYVDSEGVSADRLRQICGGRYDEIMRNFLIYKPTNMEAMGRDLHALDKIPDLGLVIVDSVNIFTRFARSEENGYDRTFLDQILHLQRFARERDIPILVTAQVYGTGSDVLPFSGRTLAHLVKTIVRLEKLGVGLRKAVIIKHRSQPELKETEFTLTAFGIV